MHSLKAAIVNQEQKKLKDKPQDPLIALSASNSQSSMFSKPSKLHAPFVDQKKHVTIKKILNDLEKDLNKVEEENYHIIKEQAEIRMLKANPKLAAQRQKQIEKELAKSPPLSPNRGARSKLSMTQKAQSTKKLIKDVYADQLNMLNGQFQASIKLNKFEDEDKEKEKPVYTYQQHRLLLKKQGVTYFEKYQPPKKDPENGYSFNKNQEEETQETQKPLTPPMTNNLMRNFSLPSLNDKKKKNPNSQKQDQDALIFNEVFIQPRAVKLNQIMLQHELQQQQQKGNLPLLQNSIKTTKARVEEKATKYFLENRENRLMGDKQKIELSALLQSKKMMEQSEKIVDKEIVTDQDQRLQTAYSHQTEQSELLDERDLMVQSDNTHLDDVVKIVMRKFNQGAKIKNCSSFFTQQIQVQPPEGLINSIGGNIKESSWAPSIPISTTFLKQQSLKDITLRAKAGVQAGDIQKEAHMAFALGNLNEEQKNYKKAIKFYKRFFFCARILEDPVGASLGLNRLGVMYHKIKNYAKSLQFHQKHQQFTDSENLFASYYNLGIAYRLQKQFDESIQQFTSAFEWSLQHQELESECISNGQLGVTYLIIKNNEASKIHFENCLKIASSLKNKKLQLDCLLCLGYIAFTQEDYKTARTYFHKAFNAATQLNDREIAEQCLCNMGISMGNIHINNMKRNFSMENLNRPQREDSEEDE